MEKDQAYLSSLITPLLDYPEELNLERKVDLRGIGFIIRINPTDIGRVIGQEGATIIAIRQLLRVFGYLQDSNISVKVWTPGDNRTPR